MLQIFVFLGLLLLAALGLGLVADTPGEISIVWADQTYRMKLLTAAVIGLAAIVAAVMVWSFLKVLFRLPKAIAASGQNSRDRRGLQAISRGLVAVGSGDSVAAEKHAREARALLKNAPAALLLAAQSAQLSGRRDEARAAFGELLNSKETKLLGLRGLFIEARRSGDPAAARYAANEAYALAPAVPWVGAAVLEDRCRSADWEAAASIVEHCVSRRVIDKDTGRRLRAVLLTARALAAEENYPARALDLARQALKLDAKLVPAAGLAGRLLGQRGEISRAARIVETAWKALPHPDLARVYLSLRPGDSALDRLSRAKRLHAIMPGSDESGHALAWAAIDAREFKIARDTLLPLTGNRQTARVCTLMAALEDREHGSSGLVREWLSRAARAPRDNAWVADGHISSEWFPVSPVSARLDAYVWMVPPQAETAIPELTFEASGGVAGNAMIAKEGLDPPAPAKQSPPAPVAFALNVPPDDPGPRQRR